MKVGNSNRDTKSPSVILIRGRSLAIDPTLLKVADALSEGEYDVNMLVWDRLNSMEEKEYNKNSKYKITIFHFRAPTDKPTAVFFHPIWWLYIFGYLLKKNYDIIHANDWDTLPPCVLIKFIKKKPLIYTVYDFYAHNLPDGRFNFLRKIVRKFFSLAEKFGIGFTDALFLVDESRYEEVAGAKIKKLDYIYNSPPDYSHIYPPQKDKKEMIVFYAGLITKFRGIQHMIDAISQIDDVKLILAGKVSDTEILEYASKFPDKVEYVGILPTYKEIIKKTFDADVLFRFSDPTLPKTKYESSNKLFEAMMAGKPIIVSEGSSMAKIVKEENCGIVIPYGDIQSIKDALTLLKNDANLRLKMGKNGRKAYENKYSWEIMKRRILRMYKEAIEFRKD
ncbi:MAG: glycosyltransferase family 4 protein [Thermoplasmatales archaeon]|nr:glycosyltransferase family 4 protein [Thermoplasmatales archaeon]